MLYLLAVVLPPLAVLLCGKPLQALLSIPLTLLGWAPGVIHALFVVQNHYADQRSQRLIRAVERNRGLA
ncbi:MAG: YqaE/Pmp3 family membrane protein [Chloroflexota bacterium]|nr:YqaE/Pmp3 family membrane protein [Chloroflexota bacterium]